MALIVENGSIVAGANSYVTRADFIAYAASIGVTITDDVTADEALIQAAQYIDQHEPNMQGTRTARDNAMAFPRWGVVIDSWYWNSNEIPRQAILAQQAFAIDIHNGIDLWNKSANPNLITSEERVEGAVTVKYAVPKNGMAGSDQKMSRTSTGDALLATLLNRSGLGTVDLMRS